VSQRDRILIIVVAILGLGAGGWFVVAKPKRRAAADLETQIVSQQGVLANASQSAADYRAARTRLRKHPEVFEQSARALPNRVAMPELLRSLSKTTDGTNVQMTTLTTAAGTSTATAGITSVDLNMTFSGGFLELQHYLSRLQKFVKVSRQKVAAKGRLVALDSVQLAPKANALTATVKATVYILQPGALTAAATAVGATADPAAATAAAPGAPTSPSTPTGGTQ
jgi:Tfp pilus assembly protein PilO